MDWRVGSHGVEECDVINTFPNMWKQIRNPFAAFAVLFKIPAWFHDPTLITVTAASEGLHVHGFVIHALHIWLVIKRIDMTRATIHIKEDDRLRLGRKVWCLGS